jgi:hypothetical protein
VLEAVRRDQLAGIAPREDEPALVVPLCRDDLQLDTVAYTRLAAEPPTHAEVVRTAAAQEPFGTRGTMRTLTILR